MLVLKVLSGPTCGAEIVLPGKACLVRTVPTLEQFAYVTDDVHEAESAQPVITIPVSGEGANFLIRCTDLGREATTLQVEAECYSPDGAIEIRSLAINEVLHVGALHFALREAHQEWSRAVRQGVLHQTASSSRPSWKLVTAACAMVCVLGGIVFALTFAIGRTSDVGEMASIAEAEHCALLSGKDGQLYLIAPGAFEADRVRRVLLRTASSVEVEVRSACDEVASVERVLTQAGIGFFAINADDPGHPLLVLRRDDSAPEEATVRKLVSQALPYVHGVKIVVRDGEQAREDARRLTSDIGVRASFEQTPNHFTVHVTDHLSDTALEGLGVAMHEFEQRWGRHYVRFLVDQRDADPANSLRTGAGGYALVGAKHFSFPSER